MTFADLPELKDADAVAATLGCERQLVYRLVASGRLKATRVGRLMKFTAQAIADYLAAAQGDTDTDKNDP